MSGSDRVRRASPRLVLAGLAAVLVSPADGGTAAAADTLPLAPAEPGFEDGGGERRPGAIGTGGVASVCMEELAEGLWRWTGRHPEWHPGEWGAEVASFALDAGNPLLLIDPLVPDDDDVGVLDRLDTLARGPVAILITIPYHTRSAERLWMRYRTQGCTIHGHPAVAKRLSDASGFTPLEAGAPLPGGAQAFAIGKPRRYETPFHLPSHRALAFGDALVATPDGELRIWHADTIDDARVRWYRERFVPTFGPILELELDRILVTHGAPILRDGSAALEAALAAPPWYHRP